LDNIQFFSEAAVAFVLVSTGRQGFVEILVNPRKTFKKVLTKPCGANALSRYQKRAAIWVSEPHSR